MISVVVGTRNKLKAEAVKEAFKKVVSNEVEVYIYKVDSSAFRQSYEGKIFQ